MTEPADLRKFTDQYCPKCETGVTPQVFAVIFTCDAFIKSQTTAGTAIILIRLTHQHLRQSQRKETTVIVFTHRTPAHVIMRAENFVDIDMQTKVIEIIQTKKLRGRTADKRTKRRSCSPADALQGKHIINAMVFIRPVRNVVVTQQNTERLPTGRTKLFVVDQMKQAALIEVWRTLHITSEILPADIQQSDFSIFGINNGVDQKPEAAPGSFERLKALIVQNGINLLRNQLINKCDLLSQPTTRLQT